MKLPFFKFYPQDWLSDQALQLCSYAARGLWIQLLALMGANEARRGYLESHSGPIVEPAKIARLTGGAPDEAAELLRELEQAGILTRDDRGCIYSRRMVEDTERMRQAAEDGKRGGNPNLTQRRTPRAPLQDRRAGDQSSPRGLTPPLAQPLTPPVNPPPYPPGLTPPLAQPLASDIQMIRLSEYKDDRSISAHAESDRNRPFSSTDVDGARGGREIDSSGGREQATDTSTEAEHSINALAEIIFKEYPRKVGKQKGLEAIIKALRRGKDFLKLRAITRAYAEAVAAKNANPQFIPHPARWFNEERYNDDPAEWARNVSDVRPRRRESVDRNAGTSNAGTHEMYANAAE